MFLGVARQPLAIPEPDASVDCRHSRREPTLRSWRLPASASASSVRRWSRSAEGVPDAARHLHEDPTPAHSRPARRAAASARQRGREGLRRAAVRAAVRRVARVGFRLHPFDLPRLIGYIKGDAACLGLAERAYLALADVLNKTDAPSLLHAEITTENWTEFPKGHRVAFLREERRKDPAAARAPARRRVRIRAGRRTGRTARGS